MTRQRQASCANPTAAGCCPGCSRPDEIQAAIDLELPVGHADYETVAGLILQLLGRIPRPGERIEVPGATLTVERMDGLRIDRVGVTLHLDTTDVTRPDRPGITRTDDEGGGA
jgi:magnesium and cobalt exporter, CNNM family